MAKRLGIRKRDSDMVRSVSEQAKPDEHAGAGHVEVVAVSEIVQNESNPRFHSVSAGEIQELRDQALQAAGLEHLGGAPAGFLDTVSHCIDEMVLKPTGYLSAEERRERLHGINDLARSINQLNLLQPILVYPHPDGYEVAAGQRRYLAHVLLGRKEIRTIVRQPSGDRLTDSLAAVVENLAREELTLRERVEAISEVARLHEERYGKPITGVALQDYISESERTCQRYLKILRAPAVREAIRKGEITSYRNAAQAVEALREDRGWMSNATDAGRGQVTQPAPKTGQAQSAPRYSHRPRKKVSLGATQRPAEVERLITGFLGEEQLRSEYGEVDWSDLEDVQAVWKSFWSKYIAEAGGDG